MKLLCPACDDMGEIRDFGGARDSIIEVGIEIYAELFGCS